MSDLLAGLSFVLREVSTSLNNFTNQQNSFDTTYDETKDLRNVEDNFSDEQIKKEIQNKLESIVQENERGDTGPNDAKHLYEKLVGIITTNGVGEGTNAFFQNIEAVAARLEEKNPSLALQLRSLASKKIASLDPVNKTALENVTETWQKNGGVPPHALEIHGEAIRQRFEEQIPQINAYLDDIITNEKGEDANSISSKLKPLVNHFGSLKAFNNFAKENDIDYQIKKGEEGKLSLEKLEAATSEEESARTEPNTPEDAGRANTESMRGRLNEYNKIASILNGIDTTMFDTPSSSDQPESTVDPSSVDDTQISKAEEKISHAKGRISRIYYLSDYSQDGVTNKLEQAKQDLDFLSTAYMHKLKNGDNSPFSMTQLSSARDGLVKWILKHEKESREENADYKRDPNLNSSMKNLNLLDQLRRNRTINGLNNYARYLGHDSLDTAMGGSGASLMRLLQDINMMPNTSP